MGMQRFQLGAKQHRPTRCGVIQRLLAEPIAGEVQSLRLAIPQREREHSVEALERPMQPPLRNGLEQNFRIGSAPKLVAELGELPTQYCEVVNLPIECHHITLTG